MDSWQLLVGSAFQVLAGIWLFWIAVRIWKIELDRFTHKVKIKVKD